jgi:hypothetical protein
MVSQGYVVAEELEDGSPGRPVGGDDGSVALFDDLGAARAALLSVATDTAHCPKMSVFKVNVAMAGKVITT